MQRLIYNIWNTLNGNGIWMFYVINNVHYIKDGNQIYKTNLISLKKKQSS